MHSTCFHPSTRHQDVVRGKAESGMARAVGVMHIPPRIFLPCESRFNNYLRPAVCFIFAESDKRGWGLPCALDQDCLDSRGLVCQDWLCACSPATPVKVDVNGVEKCFKGTPICIRLSIQSGIWSLLKEPSKGRLRYKTMLSFSPFLGSIIVTSLRGCGGILNNSSGWIF